MAAFMATVSLLLALGFLGFSGVMHALDIGRFASQIEDQRVVSTYFAQPIALGVTSIELGFPAGAVFAAFADWQLFRYCMLLSAAAYVAFGTYAAFLWARRPGAPCGCAMSAEPANVWTVIRAGALALAAFGGAALANDAATASGPVVPAMTLAVLSSLGLGLLLWLAPLALEDPTKNDGIRRLMERR
jgi:hypothetical protein